MAVTTDALTGALTRRWLIDPPSAWSVCTGLVNMWIDSRHLGRFRGRRSYRGLRCGWTRFGPLDHTVIL